MVIAIGLLSVVSLGVAQLFAQSTRANVTAKGRTSATTLAEQKLEQIRSLTWGFDPDGLGLPVTDTTSNLAVYPPQQNGSGLNPSPDNSLEQNTPGFVDFLDAQGTWVGTGTTPSANGGVHPPLVDSAPAHQSQQLARDPGAGHAYRQRERAPGDDLDAHADARRRAAHHDENEEGTMTPPTLRRSEAGYSLIELLVASAVMLVVTGAIFGLMNPSQGMSQAAPEVSDMQQRMRVSTDALFRELVMAGAGTYQGNVTGSLINFFAPILPRRIRPGQSGSTDRLQARRHHPDLHSQYLLADDDQPADASAIGRAEGERPTELPAGRRAVWVR